MPYNDTEFELPSTTLASILSANKNNLAKEVLAWMIVISGELTSGGIDGLDSHFTSKLVGKFKDYFTNLEAMENWPRTKNLIRILTSFLTLAFTDSIIATAIRYPSHKLAYSVATGEWEGWNSDTLPGELAYVLAMNMLANLALLSTFKVAKNVNCSNSTKSWLEKYRTQLERLKIAAQATKLIATNTWKLNVPRAVIGFFFNIMGQILGLKFGEFYESYFANPDDKTEGLVGSSDKQQPQQSSVVQQTEAQQLLNTEGANQQSSKRTGNGIRFFDIELGEMTSALDRALDKKEKQAMIDDNETFFSKLSKRIW